MGALISKLVFQPPHPSTYTQYELDGLRIISTAGGHRIPVAVVQHPRAHITVLFSHGNAEDLGVIWPHLHVLSSFLGVNVVAYDYSGYGISDGSPSEQAVYEDLAAVYRYCVTVLCLPPSSIVLYGRSLGTAAVCELACTVANGCAAVILQSPFLSILQLARYMHHAVPHSADMFCNDRKVGRIRCPTTVVHGDQDLVVPLEHGQQLHQMLHNARPALWMANAGHNDIESEHFDRYILHLRTFLAAIPLVADAPNTAARIPPALPDPLPPMLLPSRRYVSDPRLVIGNVPVLIKPTAPTLAPDSPIRRDSVRKNHRPRSVQDKHRAALESPTAPLARTQSMPFMSPPPALPGEVCESRVAAAELFSPPPQLEAAERRASSGMVPRKLEAW